MNVHRIHKQKERSWLYHLYYVTNSGTRHTRTTVPLMQPESILLSRNPKRYRLFGSYPLIQEYYNSDRSYSYLIIVTRESI